ARRHPRAHPLRRTGFATGARRRNPGAPSRYSPWSQAKERHPMRMLAVSAVLAAAFTVLPAQAEDHIVTAFAGPFRFEPAELTIAPGDTVTFVNGGGFHNVVSDPGSIVTFRCADGCDGAGGNGDPSSADWSATVTFPVAGTAPYFCEVHGAPGGIGMAGLITVAEEVPTPVLVVEPEALAGSAETGATTTVPFGI